MNFVCNWNIDKNSRDVSIIEFMSLLNMSRAAEKEEFFDKQFKLKHIIHLYEELESLVENIEVENISKGYNNDINNLGEAADIAL
jgi:hypothetical protein